MIIGSTAYNDNQTDQLSSADLVYMQSHHLQIGTISNDTSDDVGGRGRHFKSSEPKPKPLTLTATSLSVY